MNQGPRQIPSARTWVSVAPVNRPGVLLALLFLAALSARADVPSPAEGAPPVVEAPAPVVAPSEAPAAAAPPAPDPLLDEPLSDPAAPMASEGMGDLLGSFARTMLMLCLVLGLVYLTLHKGVGKLVQRSQVGKRMRVVERVGLDPRRALYIVDVDGREMLIGTGEGGMVHLADLGEKPADAAQSAPRPKVAKPFAKALEDTGKAREEKEGAA